MEAVDPLSLKSSMTACLPNISLHVLSWHCKYSVLMLCFFDIFDLVLNKRYLSFIIASSI